MSEASEATGSLRAAAAPRPAFLGWGCFLVGVGLAVGCRSAFDRLLILLGFTTSTHAVLLGVSAVALSFGGLLYARFVSRRLGTRDHLLLLQLALAAASVLTLGLLLLAGLIYRMLAAIVGAGVVSGVVTVAIVLGPLFLAVGAMLPALRQYAAMRIAALVVGLSVGVLCDGFVVAGYSTAVAMLIAAGAQLAAAGFFVLGRSGGIIDGVSAPPAEARRRENLGQLAGILVAVALLGSVVIVSGVHWARYLRVILGDTVQVHYIVTGVSLFALGAGALVGAMFGQSVRSPRLALGWSFALASAALYWTMQALNRGIPNWPVNNFLPIDSTFLYQILFMQCCWALVPPMLCWGAALPLALAASADLKPRASSSVALIVAALGAGVFLGAIFPRGGASLGLGSIQRVLIFGSAIAALAVMVPELVVRARRQVLLPEMTIVLGSVLLALAIPVLTDFWMRDSGFHVAPWQTYAFGRRYRVIDSSRENREMHYEGFAPVFTRQGRESAVLVTRLASNDYRLHVDGRTVASSLPDDLRRQLMMGHLPALLQPAAKKNVLVLGCGAGITAGAFVMHDLESMVICEREPAIIEALSTPVASGRAGAKGDPPFASLNNHILHRTDEGNLVEKRVRVVIDDPRHFLLTTSETFDVITLDDPQPWTHDAALGQTVEYLELARSRLKPGGLFAQWMPLNETGEETGKIRLRTFFEAFPDGTVWTCDGAENGYGLVLLGGNRPLTIDAAALHVRLNNQVLSNALAPAQMSTQTSLLRTYAGRGSELKAWLAGVPVNHDGQFAGAWAAGRTFSENRGWQVQRDLLTYRKFPADIIQATAETRKEIEANW